jgi:hypothetical protein
MSIQSGNYPLNVSFILYQPHKSALKRKSILGHDVKFMSVESFNAIIEQSIFGGSTGGLSVCFFMG